ncbi:efflux RND transporter periplasmic adaptor subunit [Hyphomonas sp.]|uniref:efflux RND transporter periplasmic adaptor subunit n=1 Tax=Hyphomonas sp. TaxID=87 RepID=UPI00391ADA0E
MTDPAYTDAAASPPRKSGWFRALIFLVLLGSAGALLLSGALLLRSPTGPVVAERAPEPLRADVMQIAYVDMIEVDELYSGLAEARRTSRLGFQTGGRIETISVRIGDKVEPGATLARLDTRSLNAQLASANAVVEEARAAHRLALDTAQRQRTLMAQGHVSQQRVDEASAQADTAAARIDSARAQADTLRVQIDLARITAPFAGTVTARFADEGAIAGSGQTILELVETGDLEARIGVPARATVNLKPGETYLLASDIGEVPARLRSLTGVVDLAQRTVGAVFDIDEASGVPAGSIVRLRMPRKMDERGFWVPLKAMTSANRGLWTVYVAVEEGGTWRARPRLVESVYPAGDRVFVRGPVEPGERIIIDGLHRIVPGAEIIPHEDKSASAGNGG